MNDEEIIRIVDNDPEYMNMYQVMELMQKARADERQKIIDKIDLWIENTSENMNDLLNDTQGTVNTDDFEHELNLLEKFKKLAQSEAKT